MSLCNVIYKVISKVLVAHMKPLSGKLIDPSQSTFVSNRLIIDNIIIAVDDFHWLKQGLGGRQNQMFSIKANMSKAYDRVKRQYLGSILEKDEVSLSF